MDFYYQVAALKEKNQSFVTATVVSASGSSPGKSGFKMLYRSDGSTIGTVGGGDIEAEAIKYCRECLSQKKNDLVEYLLSANAKPTNKNVRVVAMSCSGTMKIFYESFCSQPDVYIFGGGHVGHALLYQLKPLSFHTILVDNREVFARADKNPDADQIIHMDYLKYAETFSPGESDFVILLTHGHEFDYDISRIIFERKLRILYLGIIASKNKAEKIKEKLKKAISPPLPIDIVHSPIGLDIGGDSAEEIALSIAAQIQKTATESI